MCDTIKLIAEESFKHLKNKFHLLFLDTFAHDMYIQGFLDGVKSVENVRRSNL
jgi:hypothetical protein